MANLSVLISNTIVKAMVILAAATFDASDAGAFCLGLQHRRIDFWTRWVIALPARPPIVSAFGLTGFISARGRLLLPLHPFLVCPGLRPRSIDANS